MRYVIVGFFILMAAILVPFRLFSDNPEKQTIALGFVVLTVGLILSHLYIKWWRVHHYDLPKVWRWLSNLLIGVLSLPYWIGLLVWPFLLIGVVAI